MRWLCTSVAAWFALALVLPACGEEESTPTGSPYYPVAVGNRWVYDEVEIASNTLLATVTKEISDTETHAGVKTFVRFTTQTNSPVVKRTHWRVSGDRVLRLDQDRLDADGNLLTSRTYDPGFMRFDDSLTEVGATLQEQHVRSEYNAAGTLMAQVTKEYTWTVEAVDDTVTVPAGTFTCVRVRRVDADVGNEQFWYAKNVGAVKEDDGVEQELLREYTVE